ncbi:MAG: hypothetical protein DRH57_08660 [Candidatus Cloacimonadota bacterium]|nr:MAG: hypothetical protein DRH57_08660 [Candidatus Cloacimonadota bacterium]
MRKIYIALIVICLVSINAFAQTDISTPFNSANKIGLNNFSLLNPNKLDIRHQYSFFSGYNSYSKRLFYANTFTNIFRYGFSPKLNLSLELNWVNYGSGMMTSRFSYSDNKDNQTKILPNFRLDYSPTKNIQFQLYFQSYTIGE